MALAVTVAEPCDTPVRVNEPVVLPEAMVTVPGETVATPEGLDAMASTVPVVGAGELKVTVPVTLCPTPTPAGRLTAKLGVVTLIVVVADVYPVADARRLVTPTIWGVTVTVVLAALAGIVTLDVMETTAGSKPEKLTVNPLGLAAGTTVTVRVPGAFAIRLSGLGLSVIFIVLALMITLTGALLTVPLFTTSCATYVPETSARNIAVAEVGLESLALLPCGTCRSDQE